jgi:hypothetical protein
MGNVKTPEIPFQINYIPQGYENSKNGVWPMDPNVTLCSESVDVSYHLNFHDKLYSYLTNTGNTSTVFMRRLRLIVSDRARREEER